MIAEVSLMPDATIFIQLGIFLAVLAILHFLVFKPALRIFRHRFEKTEGDRKKIEALTEKTRRLMEEYETKMNEARKEANELKDLIRKEGSHQANKLIHDAKELRLQELERVRIEVEKAYREAQKKLESGSKELGIQITEKILERKIVQ